MARKKDEISGWVPVEELYPRPDDDPLSKEIKCVPGAGNPNRRVHTIQRINELKRRMMDGENPITVATELGYPSPGMIVKKVLRDSNFEDSEAVTRVLRARAEIRMSELKDDALRWWKIALNEDGIPPAIRERAAEAVIGYLSKHRIPLEEAVVKEDTAMDRRAMAQKYLDTVIVEEKPKQLN